MPTNIIKSFASRSGKSVEEVETLWKKAKEVASKEGHTNDYPYIVGILKRMTGINESIEALRISEKISVFYGEEQGSFKEIYESRNALLLEENGFQYGYSEFMLYISELEKRGEKIEFSNVEIPTYTERVIEFAKTLATKMGIDIEETFTFLKNPGIHRVFYKMGMDFKKVFKTLKKAYALYIAIMDSLVVFIEKETHVTGDYLPSLKEGASCSM